MHESDLNDEHANLLFSTENGWVRHCACRNLLVLQYQGYWLALSPEDFAAFHSRLAESAGCPMGRKCLTEGGRLAFRTEGGVVAFTLGEPEVRDLLWLIDSARFMLEARESAARGFAAQPYRKAR